MKNDYEIRGEVTAIFLTQGNGNVLETVIDTVDLSKAQSFRTKWYPYWSKDTQSFYVYGNLFKNGRHSVILLHRCLFDNPEGYVIDHFNHETLDNRRSTNLRKVTDGENKQNKKLDKRNKSGIRGVYWGKNRWNARMSINKQVYNFGGFETIDAAAKVIMDARAVLMPFSFERSEKSNEELKQIKIKPLHRDTGLYENNTSGVKGVNWHNKSKKWHVRTQVNGKRFYCGSFDDFEEAKQALEKFNANKS